VTKRGIRSDAEIMKTGDSGEVRLRQCSRSRLPGSDLGREHVRNFLDCVKSRQLPKGDVEQGYHTCDVPTLGNIATKGRAVPCGWDPGKEEINGDREANQLARSGLTGSRGPLN